jgi:hypothetical protein
VGIDIWIVGRVKLHIPIPYGFGAVVSVKVSDKSSGVILNCEEVDVSSKLLPPPNATGANVIVVRISTTPCTLKRNKHNNNNNNNNRQAIHGEASERNLSQTCSQNTELRM